LKNHEIIEKFRFICALFMVSSLFIISCSKLGDGNEVSPFGTSNTLEEARFKEFDLVKSEKVNKKDAIVFDSRDEAYSFLKKLKSFKSSSEEQNKFVADILLESLRNHNPEQYNVVLQSLTDKKTTQSTNEDEGALPDYGPRYRNPCTNALMEGNGMTAGLGYVNFTAQTNGNGDITSVATSLGGWSLGFGQSSNFNTNGATFNSSTGEYKVEGTVYMSLVLFFEGVGNLYTWPVHGILKIRIPRGGCGSSAYSVDFEQAE
jgi:hypothetical protein